MAKLLLNRIALTAIWVLFALLLTTGTAQAGTIEVFVTVGIRDEAGILPLQGDGGPTSDMVQLIYAGLDGVPNPPGVGGAATGDDRILRLEAIMGQYYARIGSGFPFHLHKGKFHADFRHNLSRGAKIFLRAWNAPTVAESTHYGDSASYPVRGVVGESWDFAPTESWSTNTEPPPGVGKDITPPHKVTNFQALAGNRQVTLTWTNPVDVDFAGVLIRRKVGSYPTGFHDGVPYEGVVVFYRRNVEIKTWTDARLSPGNTYYYAAFAFDTSRNYASGAQAKATPWAPLVPAPDPAAACFIATAVYGTPMAEEVRILARFRDERLLTNEWGQKFVAFYYTHSPTWAGRISGRENLKALIRIGLKPLIWLTKKAQ